LNIHLRAGGGVSLNGIPLRRVRAYPVAINHLPKRRKGKG
jgi:hypothetical protein